MVPAGPSQIVLKNHDSNITAVSALYRTCAADWDPRTVARVRVVQHSQFSGLQMYQATPKKSSRTKVDGVAAEKKHGKKRKQRATKEAVTGPLPDLHGHFRAEPPTERPWRGLAAVASPHATAAPMGGGGSSSTG